MISNDELALKKIANKNPALDFLELTPEQYVKKAVGGPWGKPFLNKKSKTRLQLATPTLGGI